MPSPFFLKLPAARSVFGATLLWGCFVLVGAAEPKHAGAIKPSGPPYPPSPVIKAITWAPKNEIIRLARGSDNWPMTWADDDALYGAYGDGNGFEPFVPAKLSVGFAKVTGYP